MPLICHYTSNPTRFKQVYLPENYTEELASPHGIISYGGISFHFSASGSEIPSAELMMWVRSTAISAMRVSAALICAGSSLWRVAAAAAFSSNAA